MNYINEHQAIADMLDRIDTYKRAHGKSALKSAIENGAFHIHPEYGDLTYVLKERDFDHDKIDIPLWITDMYADSMEEEVY
jgi:hypothetical protein